MVILLAFAYLYLPLSLLSLASSHLPFSSLNQHTNCKELRVFVSLNLAVSYMKVGAAKEMELAALMTSVNSDGATIT